MSTANNASDGADLTLHKRVASGRKLAMSCMGASLAGCFVIAGASLQGDAARHAMYALVVSIPLLAIHPLVTSPGHEARYDVSFLMRMTTVLGMLAMALGLGFLFERSAAGAGALFGIVSFLCGVICVQANDRAIAKARKRAARMHTVVVRA
jgi:FtsH-binding integral membrane protein